MHLFGTSGIRGIADTWLIQLSLKVGLAVGKVYSSVGVASDTRTSSDAMKHALVSGLLASGAKCVDAGVIPTPTLALAAKGFKAGAMITASHNPPEYNGIKLINPDGSAFDAHQRRQIEEIIASESFNIAPWSQIQSSGTLKGAVKQHIERILHDLPPRLKLKVVVDCGGGAASVITPHLLREPGCEVITLNCHPNGSFPREIEPTEANLGDLMKATKELDADLGIAHDGDGDRMMAVDDRGRFIPGDKLLALFAQEVRAKKVVTTIDASMAIDEMGLGIARTRVGDTYVSEALKNGGGDFGGEPSGSWVFPDISLCPDGIYAATRIAAIAGRQRLSQLVDSIPRYPILRGSISSAGVIISNLEHHLTAMKPLSMTHIDGLKLSFEDSWLLVRASGTEPKIRLTAEAKTEAQVHQLYNDGIRIVKNCIKGN